jgi:hypothetical protein
MRKAISKASSGIIPPRNKRTEYYVRRGEGFKEER